MDTIGTQRPVPGMEKDSPATGAMSAPAWVKHEGLKKWVAEIAALTEPDAIHWCDGSAQAEALCQQLEASGTLRRLNPAKRLIPGWFGRIQTTSRALKIVRSFAANEKTTPVPPITGWIRAKCGRHSASCSEAPCAVAPFM